MSRPGRAKRKPRRIKIRRGSKGLRPLTAKARNLVITIR